MVALTAEPKTLNPILAADVASRAVIHRMTADLIHINRHSQEPEPAIAESWKVTDDGRRYTLKLRSGLRFSDGQPCDADDVIFSFRVYLDEVVAAPQRELLRVGGRPIAVRKLDGHTVTIELAEPYAAAHRLFDGLAILPRHLLEAAYEAGRLAEVWDPTVAPEEIAGLGPFKLKEARPGEHLILERNPHYWKVDGAGHQLPYFDELVFLFVPDQDAQVVRFQAGEIDLIERLSTESYALLERDAERRGHQLYDLGPGLDTQFLFFNLNDLTDRDLPDPERKQVWFRDVEFRRAVRLAIDLDGIVRLVHQGRAAPMASHVTPGNRHWMHADLSPPTRSVDRARQLLRQNGFRWDAERRLLDARGQRVEISLLTVASRTGDVDTALIIQDDLRQLGIDARVVSLELKAVLDRLFRSREYEACILGLGGGSPDPNRAINLLMSTGSHHFWRLGESQPATPWQAEIDRLMRRQLGELDPRERKRLYDRVQEIVAEQLPLIGLVSPHVMVGAKATIGNFRPAVLDHQTLWNVEEMFWR